jgi:hypothetical protein
MRLTALLFDPPTRAPYPVGYRAHCPMEEVQGFDRSHWLLPLGANRSHQTNQCQCFFLFFHIQLVEKGRWLMLRPQLTIGV